MPWAPDASPTPTYPDVFAGGVEKVVQQGTAAAIGGMYLAQAMAQRRAGRLDDSVSVPQNASDPERITSAQTADATRKILNSADAPPGQNAARVRQVNYPTGPAPQRTTTPPAPQRTQRPAPGRAMNR